MTTEAERIVWAFPWKMGEYECTGMTLRDYFAAAALTGMISECDSWEQKDKYASNAYSYADAMLKARKEGV